MTLEHKIAGTVDLIKAIEREFSPAALASSFGVEDMVLTDLIVRHAPKIEIFTLDTGRLPPETYELMQRTTEHFRRKVRLYFPDSTAVESYVRINGINGFYESVTQRKECCHVRKVEPLKRALAGKKAWLTGLRRDQSVTRQDLSEREFDAAHKIEKFSPLLEWTHLDIWTYVSQNQVPYNVLHDRGYPSIGCAPCTRAIQPGEDIRAGRWWWEDAAHKECGLHVDSPTDASRTDADVISQNSNPIRAASR